jgi:heat-inducible transcriptional repressor
MEFPSLTDRQIQILKNIIEEYIETGEPVGSETLDKKFNLGVSPATIRNEMVILSQQNYLSQPHTSSGRTPTSMALKFYISQLMKEKDLSVSEEVDVKSRIWDYKNEANKLLRETTRILSQKTNAIAIATTDHGDVFHAGYANILDIPEFFDIDVTKTVLSILDDGNQLQLIFEKVKGDDPINILIGEDFDIQFLSPCGIVYTRFPMGEYATATIGVIGPARLNYPYIIPVIRYFGNLLADLTQEWK